MKKLFQKEIETREMFIPYNLQNIFLKKNYLKATNVQDQTLLNIKLSIYHHE